MFFKVFYNKSYMDLEATRTLLVAFKDLFKLSLNSFSSAIEMLVLVVGELCTNSTHNSTNTTPSIPKYKQHTHNVAPSINTCAKVGLCMFLTNGQL